MSSKFLRDGAGTFDDYCRENGIPCTVDSIDAVVLSSMIDHTLLKPEATESDIIRLCREAAEYQFKSVCVNPCHVARSVKELNGAGVKVCTVIGFPLGANMTLTKAREAVIAVEQGAGEIDMVMNIGALKSGDPHMVGEDIREVVNAVQGTLVKVILETCLLSGDEIENAASLSMNAGAGFVKTSTGFSSCGATLEAVALMRKTAGKNMGVKASGGIRERETALAMIRAGATRIGTSAGIDIVRDIRSNNNGVY